MTNEPYSTEMAVDASTIQVRIKSYLNKVFAWMAVSMLLTAGSAIYASNNADMLLWGAAHPFLLFFVLIGIILVMGFGRAALPASVLGVFFLAFSVLEGLALTPILLMYDVHSLGITFACTAGMFGCMALYGATTKKDLSGWRTFLMMSLFGLIIAGIANCFFGNGMADLVISGFGLLVFSCFTAYDMQMLVQQGFYLEGEDRSKFAILGALSLYLDFLNLFLYLLRFLGNRD